jgi:xanthine dehydrogenase YagR molybdenum-binding subunit
MGMAAAFRNNLVMKSAARVRLERDGKVTVETDMTDIGTGSYTIIAQTAAEMMGLPLDRWWCGWATRLPGVGRLGRPVGRQQLDRRRVRGLRQAARDGGAEAGPGSRRARNSPTAWCRRRRSVPLRQAAAGRRDHAEDKMEYGDLDKKFQQSTFGAHFVEVGVDAAPAKRACGACWPCARRAAS